MTLHVIATGSSANCYLLEAGTEVLMLDAGLPVRKILPSIKDFRSLVGCLLTHEHKDHASGAAALLQRGIKVISSEGTKQAMALEQMIAVKPLSPISIGGFTVMAFETQHDAVEPFGFLIRYDKTSENVIYATDTSYLRYTFPGIHYWIIECNYCDDILEDAIESGSIDFGLRNRLIQSHMSLRRLKDLFMANDLSQARKIVLVHLSDSRSDEQRMIREISDTTGIETVAAVNGATIPLNLIPF